MYQKGYQRYNILRLCENNSSPLGRYNLKQGNPLQPFFKKLIQLYVLHFFLYYLTYCIKEAINSKIFFILNEKSVSLIG